MSLILIQPFKFKNNYSTVNQYYYQGGKLVTKYKINVVIVALL